MDENQSFTNNAPPRLLYTKKDAAYQLSFSVRSLEYQIAEGHIKPRRIGGRVLIPHEELLRFSRHDRHHLLRPKSDSVA